MASSIAADAGDDLDPDIRRFIRTTRAAWAQHPALASVSSAEARAIAERVRAPWAAGGPAMARTTDRSVAVPGGGVDVRLYEPDVQPEPQPALIYLHGGGWTLFSIATHDRLMREYAHRGGIRVIGVDYSLAPEAPFPRALDEVVAVARWLRTNAARFGIDPGRIAIGGDSAGANLALAAAIDLRDAGEGEAIKALLLNYGAFDDRCDYPSYRRYGGAGYMLGAEEMRRFWRTYLGGGGGGAAPPRAAPIRAALHDLPATLLCIAECDVLRDENIAMAALLGEAGVTVRREIYHGASHSFLEAVSIAPIADHALGKASAWLAVTLGG